MVPEHERALRARTTERLDEIRRIEPGRVGDEERVEVRRRAVRRIREPEGTDASEPAPKA
jgi:hypothetical protein